MFANLIYNSLERKAYADKAFGNSSLINTTPYNKLYNPDIKFVEAEVPEVDTSQINSSFTHIPESPKISTKPSITTLKEGSSVAVGNTVLRITDPFGIRDWGARKGEHSNGIDFSTPDKWAVAIQDGTIESVKIQGDGLPKQPKPNLHEAGYYITVKHKDGSKAQYMHFDPIPSDLMQEMVGKTVKRGDKLYTFKKGSGTQLGPHIKLVLRNAKGKILDPTPYILNL